MVHSSVVGSAPILRSIHRPMRVFNDNTLGVIHRQGHLSLQSGVRTEAAAVDTARKAYISLQSHYSVCEPFHMQLFSWKAQEKIVVRWG